MRMHIQPRISGERFGRRTIKMDFEVTSKHGFKITVYEDGNTVRYCESKNFNPRIMNARDPVFNGSMQECADYIRRN